MRRGIGLLVFIAFLIAGTQILRKHQSRSLISPAEQQALRDALNEDVNGALPDGVNQKVKLTGNQQTMSAQNTAPPDYDSLKKTFGFSQQDLQKSDVLLVSVCGIDFDLLGDAILERFAQSKNDARFNAFRAVKWALKGGDNAGDDYLSAPMKGLVASYHKNYLVVPLLWKRDPSLTLQTELTFKKWLPQLYAAAAANHKPVYVFAHSWGTILTHDVLNDLWNENSPVRIDRFVTMGSPLVPSGVLSDMIDDSELTRNKWGESVQKPKNVGTWMNFWATRDWFSASIKNADYNEQVEDSAAAADEKLFIKGLATGSVPDHPVLSAIVSLVVPAVGIVNDAADADDLAKLEYPATWHSSYYQGYQVSFTLYPSLNLDVPRQIMPKAL